jgi:GAG-pre-integrase domain
LLTQPIYSENFIKAFVKDKIEIMSGQRVGKALYQLRVIAKNCDQEDISTAAVSKITRNLSLWHQRLGHLNCKSILKMARTKAVSGLQLDNNHLDYDLCEGCIFGKMSRIPFPTSSSKADDVGHIIHSDIGIVPVTTLAGERHSEPNLIQHSVIQLVIKNTFRNILQEQAERRQLQGNWL